MFKKKQPSLDPIKSVTSELLRAADKLVRLKHYSEALVEIEKAYKIDPKNAYIRSFLERTRYLIEKEEDKRSKLFGSTMDMTTEHRIETISQLFASAEELIKEKKYRQALDMVGKVYRIDPKNYYANAFTDRIEALIQEEVVGKKIKKIEVPQSSLSKPNIPPLTQPIIPPLSQPTIAAPHTRPIQSQTIPPLPSTPTSVPQEEVRRFALYRELLKECWADGTVTPEESDMLNHARTQYSISLEAHRRIESDIKIDAYVDALRIVWIDGVVLDNEQEVLEIMRKKFGITQEEQAAAEKKFSALRKTKQVKAMILIVDDDYKNSIFVARALINCGYDVKIERRPDDALRFLNTQTPNLILSEAVFPQLDTDGFEFFQKTRSDERLSQIPFLIMTELGDARIIRAGLRMGVDYFIPKPLHIGYMVAIIEGKLKSGLQPMSQK